MTPEDFKTEYMSALNPRQAEAVTTLEGPVLLLAVPGSGKTTALVTRLGYMVLARGIPPENILAITYTRAATAEMRTRYEQRFGAHGEAAGADRIAFQTINSISHSIIRHYSAAVSGRPAFPLLDNGGDNTRLVREIYQDINSGQYPDDATVRAIQTQITYVKNNMTAPEELPAADGITDFPLVFRRYNEALVQSGRMDFDDQMVYALQILRKYPAVLRYFQSRYTYLCVDESQDTSRIQHEIIRLLAGERGNLFMVGDEDQSIFGFRAACPDALMNFEQDHPGAKILYLEDNYRSASAIVRAANGFVKRNRDRREKTIRCNRDREGKVEILPANGRVDQLRQLVLVAATAHLQKGETALLCRNNDSLLPILDRLEADGIPYRLRRSEDNFFNHRVVAEIRGIYRFACRPADPELFLQVYYTLGAGLPRPVAEEAYRRSLKSGASPLTECRKLPDLPPHLAGRLAELEYRLQRVADSPADKALECILQEMNYEKRAKEKTGGQEKILALTLMGIRHPNLGSLFERLDGLREIMAARPQRGENGVILSTIHSSKGLEYDTVFLFDVFDGLFPVKNALTAETKEERKQYQEERRLFYVGITRAKNRLVLYDLRSRPSEFVSEIRRCMQPALARSSTGATGRAAAASRTPAFLRPASRLRPAVPQTPGPAADFSAEDLQPGRYLLHKTWGWTLIAESSGVGTLRLLTLQILNTGEQKRAPANGLVKNALVLDLRASPPPVE